MHVAGRRWHPEGCSARDGMQPDPGRTTRPTSPGAEPPAQRLSHQIPHEVPGHGEVGDSPFGYSSSVMATRSQVQCVGLGVPWYQITAFARNSTGSLQPCASLLGSQRSPKHHSHWHSAAPSPASVSPAMSDKSGNPQTGIKGLGLRNSAAKHEPTA